MFPVRTPAKERAKNGPQQFFLCPETRHGEKWGRRIRASKNKKKLDNKSLSGICFFGLHMQGNAGSVSCWSGCLFLKIAMQRIHRSEETGE
jgi:hypothetical protein